MSVSRLTYIVLFACTSIALMAQSDNRCEFALTVAIQKYDKGDLTGALAELENCSGYDDLSIKEKRSFLKLKAEIGLYMQDYEVAADATTRLMIIDPFLKDVDQSQSPELHGLISDYRFNTFAIEAHAFGGPQYFNINGIAMPQGAMLTKSPEYSDGWHAGIGVGIQKRWHSFPLDIAFHLDYALNKFSNTVAYDLESRHFAWDIKELQQWISPKLFIGYTFAPNALPIKRTSGFIKVGAGLDYLIESDWVDNSTLNIDGTFVINSPSNGIPVGDSYKSRLFPVLHVKSGIEIRIHKQTLVIGVGYSLRSLRGKDNFVFTDVAETTSGPVPVEFVSDDVLAHALAFDLTFRYNFYSTQRK